MYFEHSIRYHSRIGDLEQKYNLAYRLHNLKKKGRSKITAYKLRRVKLWKELRKYQELI